jgi:type VI secretion system protein ImpF
MSGSRGPADPAARRLPVRPQLPLFDRLIDDTPERSQVAALSASELMAALQRSVRRDIEALLNARRRWRSWPPGLKELATSPLAYGIPDCTGGVFHGSGEREVLRLEIEDTIRRFEPRFRSVRVTIAADDGKQAATLRLRIEALLHAEPAPEPVGFDMIVDPTTADVVVRIDADS